MHIESGIASSLKRLPPSLNPPGEQSRLVDSKNQSRFTNRGLPASEEINLSPRWPTCFLRATQITEIFKTQLGNHRKLGCLYEARAW